MTKWTRVAMFIGASLTAVVSLFFVILYFHRDGHWTPDRFGGLPVAVACIPVCAVAYGMASYFATKWLHPRLYPYLRSRIPAPRLTEDNET